ncbi:hypothetical protein ACFX14_021299 [Malus domestica]
MWVSSAVPTCNNMVILVDAEDGDGRVLGATTLIKFVSWAAIAYADGDQLRPEFDAASTFPTGDLPRIQYEDAPKYESVSATKRFVFDASKIAALKAMVAHKVHNPTCTEVVNALIFKSSNDHEDNDHVLELYDIVAKMREGKNQFLETYAKRLRAEEWPALMIEWLQQLGELKHEH